ncbi:hypothetical protein [Paramagnetospirillum caucaseum]|uniref:hypothetical protein n=1 Tax=Paramagnetospirillum caucaseum TaxID=1244869 RepID=UPI001267840B|nr:hypothetical protein [Paramagnetospirillum caucaseum]
MNQSDELPKDLSIKTDVDQPYERVRNCQNCGCITFVILKDYRLRCFECDELFRFEDQPENLQAHDPQDDIDHRLGMISELLPWRLSYSVDEEGLAHLRTTVQGCVGDFRITDLGGGPLTAMHLETVLAHVRHAEVTVWLNDESDVRMIRAASAAINAAAAC